LLVLIVALLVLGPKRLPEMARTLGSGMRDFKAAISGEDHDEASTNYVAGETAPPAAPTTPHTPDAEYSLEPGYMDEPATAYVHDPQPTAQPETASAYEPEVTHRTGPLPQSGLSDEHEAELTNILGPPPETSAHPAEAPQEPAAPAPEHHATADVGAPGPTEVHAPAGSQPDSA
jgi:sec-independent protein translocase protein TatA